MPVTEQEKALAKMLGCRIVEGHDPRGAPCRCGVHPPVPVMKLLLANHPRIDRCIGDGSDPDDVALLLTQAGCKVELVKFISPGFSHNGEHCEGSPYYRVRDVETGRWFVVEAGSGFVFLAESTP